MLSRDGTTEQKLDVIESMMKLKKVASMIGEFTDHGPKLYSETLNKLQGENAFQFCK